MRFDAVDPGDPLTLIDRKWNVTTATKQLADLRRVQSALSQNPGVRLRIEVPNAKAERATLKALRKAAVTTPQISVEVVPP